MLLNDTSRTASFRCDREALPSGAWSISRTSISNRLLEPGKERHYRSSCLAYHTWVNFDLTIAGAYSPNLVAIKLL